ncbi:MAG: hypothetical protein Kow0090_04320 [Myxococcota bacterium]
MQKELSIIPKVFSQEIKILPSVTELFELELAYLEYRKLKENDLISRSAYLMECNGELTRHYLAYHKRNGDITLIPLFELKKLSIEKLKFNPEALIDSLVRYKEKGSYSGQSGTLQSQ